MSKDKSEPYAKDTFPLDERKKFAISAHANACFENCYDALTYILDNHLDEFHPLYKPLSAYCVLEYGKPFKRSARLGKLLTDQIIPKESKEFHEFIIRVRDKMVAHFDTKGLDGHLGEEHHLVYVDLDPRKLSVVIQEPKLVSDLIERFAAHTRGLQKKTSYFVNKRLSKLQAEALRKGWKRGTYIVDVESKKVQLRIPKPHEEPIIFWGEDGKLKF